MRYWRLSFWWYADKAWQLPIIWSRRVCGPLALACGRRYLREFSRLKALGLVPREKE